MRTEYNNYASQALEKAAQDAASCHQKYIGTEHLILGLLAQPDSLSGRVLYENGLNYVSQKPWLYRKGNRTENRYAGVYGT